jgi:hypothetical protein
MVPSDAVSSRPRSRGAASWVRVMLLVSGLNLSFLFHFLGFFLLYLI